LRNAGTDSVFLSKGLYAIVKARFMQELRG